jgi:N-acyl-D-amino-acid deacylase
MLAAIIHVLLAPIFSPPRFDYDLVLKNGTIIDGTGSDPYKADIGISEGRIAVIAPHIADGDAKQTVDEAGQIIAPGFIDVHTHAENILEFPKAWNFVHDGVTTVIVGNCGGSKLDINKFFSDLLAAKSSINVATLVGHNSVRTEAMGGAFDRPPTKQELTKMESLVSSAMRDGAVGFSTGLEYVPGTYAKTDEIEDLAQIASKQGGIYTSHMRSEGLHEKEALEETFEIGKQAAMPVEVSHIKLDCRPAWGKANDLLAQIDGARKDGMPVTQDVYPYTAYSTTLALLLPSSALDGGQAALRKRLADPKERKKILNQMAQIRMDSGERDYGWVAIASNKDPHLNGMRIPEAAKHRSGSDSLNSQIDLVLDLVSECCSSGVFFAMNEEDLETFMRNPRTMIISDSTVEKLDSTSSPHPRAFGSNARVLAEYVRGKQVLTLPDAIRRMTSLPAQTFKIRNRGVVKEGYYADLTVFDADKVQDTATFANPKSYPVGIKDVLVNGKFVLHDSADTLEGPGVPVKRDQP